MLKNFRRKGFTLVELIIVIVVIGILAAFIIVSYSGMAKKASKEAMRASARSIVRSAQAFEYQNPGNHRFYFQDGEQFNADGLKLSYGNKAPGDGIAILNDNGRVAIALYDGTFCAAKSADTDVIDVNEIPGSDCATYDVINTCDSWATIALNYDIPLDVLLSYNNESNGGSSTCGRDIKIPVESDSSDCDDFGACYKTYYSIGYIDSSTVTPYNYTYTIKLGNLPLPLSSITGANVSDKSVLSTLDDFKNYIVRKNLGDVLLYPSETTPPEIDISQAPIFQAHAATSAGMAINSVSVSCDASQCLANIDVNANDISGVTPNVVNGNSIVYMPLKFTVEFNGTPVSCFVFNSGTGTITDYNYTTPGCPSAVKIPTSIGGVAVTAIGANAFEASNLTKLYVPSSITTVGNYAFRTNNLTGGLIWNANIDSISSTVFENSKPASLTFGSNVTKIPVNFLKGAASTFTSLTIPSTITTVGAQAFEANSNLHSLTVLSSVTSVGDNAFKGVNLTGGLTWNANIDSVSTYTFSNARPASITFGSNVTKIPTNFMKGANLTFSTLNIPSTITTVGACAFEANSSITSLTVPSSVTSVGNYAFKGTTLSSGLTWNANIDSVGSETFNGTSISSVTWGSNVTKLPAYMFYHASGGFTTMTIPNTITMVGACALEGKGLTSLTIGNSVATIGNYAFKANSLTSITFPSSVTSIGSWALDSNNLTSITMNSGSTVISNWLLLTNDVFRNAYYAGGAGTYTGTQTGTWTKI